MYVLRNITKTLAINTNFPISHSLSHSLSLDLTIITLSNYKKKTKINYGSYYDLNF